MTGVMEIGSVIMKNISDAQDLLEVCKLNNKISSTLECMLDSLSSLLSTLDKEVRDLNRKALEELDSMVSEIIQTTTSVNKARESQTPWRKLITLLCSRKVNLKLYSLLHRLNSLITALTLSTTLQQSKQVEIRKGVATLQSFENTEEFKREVLHVDEIHQELCSIENATASSASSTASSSCSDAVSHFAPNPLDEVLRSSQRSLLRHAVETMKMNLDTKSADSAATENLTTLLLFREECENPDIQVAEVSFQNIIGEGGYGVVMRANWNGTLVAVKVLNSKSGGGNMKTAAMAEILGEVHTWRRLKHQNIVPFLGTCYDKDRNALCLVMELCWKSVAEVIHEGCSRTLLTMDCSHSIMKDVAEGLHYLHSLFIIHRDIKPQNVLLVETPTSTIPCAKLCDFGLTTVKEVTSTIILNTQSAGGTPAYMAPELLSIPARLSVKSDIYSYGVFIWELLEKKVPFGGQSPQAVLLGTLQGNRLPIERKPHVASWLYDLMEACWEKDRYLRPSSYTLVEAIKLGAWPVEGDAMVTKIKDGTAGKRNNILSTEAKPSSYSEPQVQKYENEASEGESLEVRTQGSGTPEKTGTSCARTRARLKDSDTRRELCCSAFFCIMVIVAMVTPVVATVEDSAFYSCVMSSTVAFEQHGLVQASIIAGNAVPISALGAFLLFSGFFAGVTAGTFTCMGYRGSLCRTPGCCLILGGLLCIAPALYILSTSTSSCWGVGVYFMTVAGASGLLAGLVLHALESCPRMSCLDTKSPV